jgi:hypothetical protein
LRLRHSEHWRLLQDLPVQSIPMILRLHPGRWCCRLPACWLQAVELALWLSDLTAVDGCLLLDHKFTVLGFGVEIQVPSFEDEMVYRALDIEAQHCVLESMESAGTRHRTAYRLCREYAECLAVVVSQDGAVKFVANHQDKVTYWNHLDL